jgi:hypothetical protein
MTTCNGIALKAVEDNPIGHRDVERPKRRWEDDDDKDSCKIGTDLMVYHDDDDDDDDECHQHDVSVNLSGRNDSTTQQGPEIMCHDKIQKCKKLYC